MWKVIRVANVFKLILRIKNIWNSFAAECYKLRRSSSSQIKVCNHQTRADRKKRKTCSWAMMLHKMSTAFHNFAGTVLLLWAFICLRILRLVPYSKRVVAKMTKVITTLDLPIDDYWGSLFSWNMFQSVRSTILGDLQKSARFGQRAPNPSVVTLDGASHPHLLNFCRGNRPLVLNFGSWSCPVFRARTQEFLEIARQFKDLADFLTVYIEEAHPSNGWAFEVRAVSFFNPLYIFFVVAQSEITSGYFFSMGHGICY